MDYTPNKNWITIDKNNQMRQKCIKVEFPLTQSDEQAIKKMIAYIDESYLGNAKKYGIRPGIGIAANQIGYQKQMFYIRLNDEKNVEQKYFLINPQMLSESPRKAYITAGEGCLSVPEDRDGYVIRSAKVKIKAFDYFQQKEIVVEGEGIFGMCLQHEYDHLQGKLYYDRINPFDPYHQNEDWVKVGSES